MGLLYLTAVVQKMIVHLGTIAGVELGAVTGGNGSYRRIGPCPGGVSHLKGRGLDVAVSTEHT